MKKALALVLALVLALSLGVSAFALDLVELKPVTTAGSYKDTLEDLSAFGYDLKNTYRAPAEGGEFYFELDADGKDLKNIEVTATGAVSAEIVKYNPEEADNKNASGWFVTKDGVAYDGSKHTAEQSAAYGKLAANTKYFTKPTGNYVWVNEKGESAGYVSAVAVNGLTVYGEFIIDKIVNEKMSPAKALEAALANWDSLESGLEELGLVSVKAETVLAPDSYEFCKAVADAFNTIDKTARYSVSNGSENYMVKLTVEPNYTAAYKSGSFKVTATRIDAVDEKGRVTESTKVTYEGKVISDVTIFEYEEVKWAGRNEEALYVGDNGYSDYLTSLDGYGSSYSEDALRTYADASVISTTAFRALREAKDGIKVNSEDLVVSIPEIGAGQKGVNFAAYGVTYLNAKGVETAKDDVAKVVFGFYGNQVVASDFTVEVDLGVDAYELRERFGEKVEEEDIITYYIVEDGKVVGQFTYDYMKDDIDEVIVLEINRKAGSTLGEYEIVLEAPAAPEGEENPNTGAESVIGV
ncbi:MAG: hypothetical protein ACI4IW_03565, partial [Oscillospiraceae bacterium]